MNLNVFAMANCLSGFQFLLRPAEMLLSAAGHLDQCDLLMFSKLYNYYWFIRLTRNASVQRKYYRLVSKEKKRLIDSGVDEEEIRLLCRHLANLRNPLAEKRLEAYRASQLKSLISFFVFFCVL
jgi:hypothetical protein